MQLTETLAQGTCELRYCSFWTQIPITPALLKTPVIPWQPMARHTYPLPAATGARTCYLRNTSCIVLVVFGSQSSYTCYSHTVLLAREQPLDGAQPSLRAQ
ncbi:hypothetical protein E2C01_033564 [Portunus trituberculatus]|uniref:Uncharacterized protein n=1 Tax=Portunus trituberculatus TaxID=210409 RepID=A0A5B7F430_PORTR|nr:hypothetical protein [Portunus trituberculatus]